MEKDIRKVVAAAKEAMDAAERDGMLEPEPISQLFQKIGRFTGMYPVPHLGVEICCGTYLAMTQQLTEKKVREDEVSRIGKAAYCSVMPRLSDPESIREFIACVVHGMGIGVIPSAEGARLLYGAQVAYSALPSPKSRKKCRKRAQNTPGNQPPTPNPSIT